MKQAKKLASLLLALVMVFALTATAFADETTPHTITITNPNAGHTYNAYQVFKGTITEDEVTHVATLSNIQWGHGVDAEGLLAELKTHTEYAACATAEDVANVLKDRGTHVDAFADVVSKYVTTVAGFANTVQDVKDSAGKDAKGYVISVTGDGYYFVKDANAVTGNDSTTKYMLRVARNVIVAPKSSVPTMEKKVKDVNDSVADSTTGWQDSADYDIGDSVPFQLKGTVAADYDLYKAYAFTFHDKESARLTFQRNTVKVYVDGTQITEGFTVNAPATDGDTFDVVFTDLKLIEAVKARSVITVEYESTLNSNAVIGRPGNPNEANLQFSNNPYGAGTGTTPNDKVVVFTFETVVNKTDTSGNPLAGAAFKLEKFNSAKNAWELVKEYTITEPTDENPNPQNPTTFSFVGLDDGKYKLTETVTPKGYNAIPPIEFEISADHNVTSDDPILVSITAPDDFNVNLDDGTLTTKIENKAGAQLPTTGGVGTTLFYVIGSVLVLAAVVLLVTKKRMSAQN